MKLIKIEWYKFSGYPAGWILMGMYVFMSLVAYTAVAKFHIDMNGSPIDGSTCFQAPDVWRWVTYISKFFLFIPVLLIIMMNSNEYSFRTYRQHVIDGLQPHQLHTAKLLFVLMLSLFCVLLCFLSGLVLSAIYTPEWNLDLMTEHSPFLFYFFLKTFGLLSMALMVSQLIRKSILVFMVLVFYYFIEMVSGWIFSYLLHWPVFSLYLPLEIFENLTPNPANEVITGMMPGVISEGLSTGIKLAVAIVYIVAFNVVSYWQLSRRRL